MKFLKNVKYLSDDINNYLINIKSPAQFKNHRYNYVISLDSNYLLELATSDSSLCIKI